MALYIRFLQFYDVLLVRRAGAAVASQSWLKWDVQGLEGLNKKNWYLLISNHHSWADIVVLCVLFRKHIPMNKYFLKQQLAWSTLHWPRLLGAGYAFYAPLLAQLSYSSPGAPR